MRQRPTLSSTWARSCFALAIATSACAGKSAQLADHHQGGAAGTELPGGGASANAASSAGTSASGSTPEAILAPLASDDATIDAKSGAELLQLALQIGYAQGYAQCRCLFKEPLPESSLDLCARGESQYQLLFKPAVARCVAEQSREVPGFDESLRCEAKHVRSLGRNYALCAQGTDTRGAGTEPYYDCSQTARIHPLVTGDSCRGAFFCGDGTFLQVGHCDLNRDCSDSSDERGCGDFMCGDQLIDRSLACDPAACPIDFSPPLCSPDQPSQLQCGDGTVVSPAQVCDAVEDCSTGRDEQYCY